MSRIYASRSRCETDVHNVYTETVQVIIGVGAGVRACRVCTRFGKSIVFSVRLSLREGGNSYCLNQDLTHLAPDQPLSFRYEIPCEGKQLCQMILVYNFKKQ